MDSARTKSGFAGGGIPLLVCSTAFAGARWRDADGRVWQEIELSALAGYEQFLGVAS